MVTIPSTHTSCASLRELSPRGETRFCPKAPSKPWGVVGKRWWVNENVQGACVYIYMCVCMYICTNVRTHHFELLLARGDLAEGRVDALGHLCGGCLRAYGVFEGEVG